MNTGLLAGTAVAAEIGLKPELALLFALTAGGAALLADLDTKDSAATKAGGILLAPVLWVFRRLAIRHRGPTHTLIVSAGAAAAILWLGKISNGWHPAYWPIRLAIPIPLAMLATRTLLMKTSETHDYLFERRHRFFIELLVGALVAYADFTAAAVPQFALGLALAVSIGFASHALIDVFFESGVPLFWPLDPKLNSHIAFGHFEVYRETSSGERRRSMADRVIGGSAFLGAILVFVLLIVK